VGGVFLEDDWWNLVVLNVDCLLCVFSLVLSEVGLIIEWKVDIMLGIQGFRQQILFGRVWKGLGMRNVKDQTRWMSNCFPEKNTIPREELPSLENFREEYFRAEKPLVILGAMKHWKALQRWNNLEFWKTPPVGNQIVEIEIGSGLNRPKVDNISFFFYFEIKMICLNFFFLKFFQKKEEWKLNEFVEKLMLPNRTQTTPACL
jgi:hypothetical protein